MHFITLSYHASFYVLLRFKIQTGRNIYETTLFPYAIVLPLFCTAWAEQRAKGIVCNVELKQSIQLASHSFWSVCNSSFDVSRFSSCGIWANLGWNHIEHGSHNYLKIGASTVSWHKLIEDPSSPDPRRVRHLLKWMIGRDTAKTKQTSAQAYLYEKLREAVGFLVVVLRTKVRVRWVQQ